MSLLALLRHSEPAALPAFALARYFDRAYVHVEDFGAVPDSTVAGGGTDSTTAWQNAINAVSLGGAHEGKVLLHGPGRYKISDSLVVDDNGIAIRGFHSLTNGAFGNDTVDNIQTRIDWWGGPDDNVFHIQATSGSLSKFHLSNMAICDRRLTGGTGNGVYVYRAVNDVFLDHLTFYGFAGGGCIYVTAASGTRSDCVSIEKVWVNGGQTGHSKYGIFAHGIDNALKISEVRLDMASGSGSVAGIHVEYATGAVTIDTIKHENTASIPTIQIGAGPNANPVNISGVASRIGSATSAGPVVKFIDQYPQNVTVENLWRDSTGGVLLHGGPPSGEIISGTHLPFYSAGKSGSFSVRENGQIVINGDVIVGKTGGTLGCYGSNGTGKPTITGAKAGNAALTALLSALAGQGLVTDSTT